MLLSVSPDSGYVSKDREVLFALREGAMGRPENTC